MDPDVAAILRRCRYDPLTKHGSVYDVIVLVTGCTQQHAKTVLQRMARDEPEIAGLPVVTSKLVGGRELLCMRQDHLAQFTEVMLQRQACLPPSASTKHGLVYAVTSPLLSAIKVGMWRGSWQGLRKRYVTVYGAQVTAACYETEDCRLTEKQAHRHLQAFHLTKELFAKEALPSFHAFCAKMHLQVHTGGSTSNALPTSYPVSSPE